LFRIFALSLERFRPLNLVSHSSPSASRIAKTVQYFISRFCPHRRSSEILGSIGVVFSFSASPDHLAQACGEGARVVEFAMYEIVK
jgi:hypothetical protein